MNSARLAAVEGFERGVVLRGARILPLLLSCLATLMLATAVMILLYSFVPSQEPKALSSIPEPRQVSVSQSEVNKYLNRNSATSSATEQATKKAPPAPSREAIAIATELQKLDRQALAVGVPRANEYQTVCRETYLGVCLGKHTVVVSMGVEGYLTEALRWHNEESTPNESVTIENYTFSINPSHPETKLAIMREMESVLDGSSPANARRMLSAWAELRNEREDIRARDYEQARQKATDAYRSAQQDFERTVAQKQQARQLSITGIGLALGSFILLGLVLAVLAIERHTRLLELRESTAPPDILMAEQHA